MFKTILGVPEETQGRSFDVFERSRADMMLPHGVGIPDMEAALMLSIVKSDPGLRKPELVKKTIEALGRPGSDERLFLHHVDSLMGLSQISRYDFGYHITPTGLRRLDVLLRDLRPALGHLYMKVA